MNKRAGVIVLLAVVFVLAVAAKPKPGKEGGLEPAGSNPKPPMKGGKVCKNEKGEECACDDPNCKECEESGCKECKEGKDVKEGKDMKDMKGGKQPEKGKGEKPGAPGPM